MTTGSPRASWSNSHASQGVGGSLSGVRARDVLARHRAVVGELDQAAGIGGHRPGELVERRDDDRGELLEVQARQPSRKRDRELFAVRELGLGHGT
jgi:hypothetical protein